MSWWKTGVVYEIYPRSFADANGDGVGDLKGIIQHLDYLNDGTPNSLGVDAIWITPFYPSPFYDFGYDVQDYLNVDPLFGSLEDFENLISEAHKRGIKIIIDLVFNHSSHLHPWFIESRSSKTNPKRDWYIWQDGRSFHRRPNNWQSVFGGSAWEYDKKTGQYYLHSFLKEQPDLNWRNPEVQEALFEIVRYWLEKGVDGFRLDVINFIFKDEALRSNLLRLGRRPYEMQYHIYDRNQSETHLALAKMRKLVDSYGAKMLVGEITLDNGEDSRVAATYYGEDNDELHLAFNFEFLNCPWSGRAFKEAVELWEKSLPKNGWPNYVLSNHDVPRHFGRYGKKGQEIEQAKLAALMLFTLRGTPFLYYGEEIGMDNVHIPRSQFQDPVGKKYWPFYPGRDEERTPMQWNGELNAGFTTAKPWLPLGHNFIKVNVANQLNDSDSLLSFYRKIIWLRKKITALQVGSYRAITGLPDECFLFLREYEDKKYLIALNFTDQVVELKLGDDSLKDGELLLSTKGDISGELGLNPLQLRGHEGLLVEIQK